jgi:tRNA (guanine37-N1)-methyltransferase
MKKTSFDIFGNIALVKFPRGIKSKDKKGFAEKLLKDNKSVTTVLEKIGKFSGRLRKQETRYIAGEKTKEVLYKENGCVFRFNIDSVYFSPRLSNERKEIAQKIKRGDEVLVMFAGVAPYPIVIAKNSKADKVYSNEINKKANEYAKMNVELNNVKNKVILLPGDIKRVAEHIKEKYDAIVMPRPQLKDSFLREAFILSKRGTRVFYYDFCKEKEIKDIVDKIKSEAKKFKKRIKILKIKKAGEIGPYKYRIRIDFKVVS